MLSSSELLVTWRLVVDVVVDVRRPSQMVLWLLVIVALKRQEVGVSGGGGQKTCRGGVCDGYTVTVACCLWLSAQTMFRAGLLNLKEKNKIKAILKKI